ncbi:SnoaL-like domain-containing protein [Pseudomaricurvus alkylphenolicus]|jgi:anthranilate 1,2-dioxygenase small subunit|uniref:aromatic-ring-hydroxylating dioxygenase subunit beta n=1 Tax=Pseudomaricurvus alkylphenolicus TaxID=1306991 RepID=UPI001421AE15|nr:aromatic-ring-hydroxylating dioxygenase subunit beta [Pseudomaricurvus alkylphenolicus]NIB40532.1 SnoaL-like domain-containing protein [Pseudomaricurvus alkylphenolicus]
MKQICSDVLSKIDDLQTRYIAVIDAKDMEGWLSTFCQVAEASYVYTTAENLRANHAMALVMDDNYQRLQDRVTIVNKVWPGTYADYATRHFVQRTACRDMGAGKYEVESNFMVMTTPEETGRSTLFATGVYFDQVVVDKDQALFLSKKVVTDSSVVERFMAYPL